MIRKLLLRIIGHYRHNAVPGWVVLFIDMALFTVAFVVAEAFALRSFSDITFASVVMKYVVSAAITLLFFSLFKSHRSMIRHTGLNDILRLLSVCAVSAVVCVAINMVNNKAFIISNDYLLSYRAIFMLYSLLAVLLLLTRFVLLYVYNQYFRRQRPESNVVIFGAGAAGMMASNALKQDSMTDYKVVAFIDDEKDNVRSQYDGVPIMRARDVLNPKFVKAKKVNQIVIAVPNIRQMHKQAITNRSLSLGLSVKEVPYAAKWQKDGFTSSQIESISIDDLLQRERVVVDSVNVVREYLDKTVLVTGAAGTVGSELCRQLLQLKPKRVVMLDQAEASLADLQFELYNSAEYSRYRNAMTFVVADINDQSRIEDLFEHYRPTIVFHAASYSQVPLMEANPYEAVNVNLFGLKTVADLAVKYGVEKFVMTSTDKAVNPSSVMGATKRMAELFMQSRLSETTRFITVRFGSVLAATGSVIPIFKKQLAAGGPLTLTHKDMMRYFMPVTEVCSLILEAETLGKGEDLFIFDMGKPVRIYDLAKKMIQLSGMKEIAIKEIGVRPGEKLYEELLGSKEKDEPTSHPKIFRALSPKPSLSDTDRLLGELHDTLCTLDNKKIIEKIKELVPEYKN